MRSARRHLTFCEARCLLSLHGHYNECIDISTMYEVDYASTRFYFLKNTLMLKPSWTSCSLGCPWPFSITPLNYYYLTSYWFLYFPIDQLFWKGKGKSMDASRHSFLFWLLLCIIIILYILTWCNLYAHFMYLMWLHVLI